MGAPRSTFDPAGGTSPPKDGPTSSSGKRPFSLRRLLADTADNRAKALSPTRRIASAGGAWSNPCSAFIDATPSHFFFEPPLLQTAPEFAVDCYAALSCIRMISSGVRTGAIGGNAKRPVQSAPRNGVGAFCHVLHHDERCSFTSTCISSATIQLCPGYSHRCAQR